MHMEFIIPLILCPNLNKELIYYTINVLMLCHDLRKEFFLYINTV